MFIPWWLITLVVVVVAWFFFKRRSIRARTRIAQPQIIEFDIEHDKDSRVSADIDSNIDYGYAKNHIRLYSRFGFSENITEYEYKIADTTLSIRILNQRTTYPGEADKCEIMDGVVQESVIRQEYKDSKFAESVRGPVETAIAERKKQTEWQVLRPAALNGLAYQILALNLPVPDARRYFREEIERLNQGSEKLADAWRAQGYEVRKTEDGNAILPIVEPSKEEKQAERARIDEMFKSKPYVYVQSAESKRLEDLGMYGLYEKVGVSNEEWMRREEILKQLRSLLGDSNLS